MKNLVEKRPTETVSGTLAALAIYGFCTQVGLPQVVAAIIAVVVLVVPYLTSQMVDALRSSRRDAEVAHLEGGQNR